MRLSEHTIQGFSVRVLNTRADIRTEQVVERLDLALGLILTHTPHYFRHLRRDFAGIVVERYACRGAYFWDSRLCMVELTFTVHPTISLPEIAATILHEGMHARLHALGLSDLEVAPEIDWRLAAQRVEEADRRARG